MMMDRRNRDKDTLAARPLICADRPTCCISTLHDNTAITALNASSFLPYERAPRLCRIGTKPEGDHFAAAG